MADAQATELPYLIVAGVLALLALMIARAKLPELGAATRRIAAEQRKRLSLWNHPNLVFGCGGIATCVWAEISVGNLFINFVSQPRVANIPHEQAAFYLTFFWGGMMVGRFAGAFIMRAIAPEKALAMFALGGVSASLVATLRPRAGRNVRSDQRRAVHLDHVPDDLRPGDPRSGPADRGGVRASDLSIAGGALVFINGKVADHFGINWAFLITALCELYVLGYALWGCRSTRNLPAEQLSMESAG